MILEEILIPVRHPTRTDLAREAICCGFELAGVAPASPLSDYSIYHQWVADGLAGSIGYLADHRALLREDPRNLLPSARSVLCVGKLYKSAEAPSGSLPRPVSSYAWGSADYHDVVRDGLNRLVVRLTSLWGRFEHKICVDTAPFLDRSFARAAGLGWIGRNTCLINEPLGSWFFLGAILVSLDVTGAGQPAPDRCGSCTRCIDACPTAAIVPGPGSPGPDWRLDARLCISTWTIEQRGPLAPEHRALSGAHLFGCDICQDVCPWNRKAPLSAEPGFQPVNASPDLMEMASLTKDEFRARFRKTPVWRSKYEGFLRNVATAMGNSREPKYLPALVALAAHEDAAVSEHARWALRQLEEA